MSEQTSEQTAEELGAQIDALVAATHREREALRRVSLTVAMVSGAMLIIVAGFMFVTYSHITTEWTEEKLAAGFQKELEVLNPSATEQLQQLGEHLLPVYTRVGSQKFVDMTPEIAARIKKEVNHLGAHLQTDAHTRLQDTVESVRTRTEDAIFSSYPGLKLAGEREKLTNSFRKLTDDSVSTTLNDFAALFATDIHELETKIRAFNVDGSDEPTVELEKRFIHLWLQLLDTEIMKK